MDIIHEDELNQILLDYLKKNRKISMDDFINYVPTVHQLSGYDLAPSESRPAEPTYEQRCRNIISHSSFPKDEIFYDKSTKIFYLK